MARDSFVSPPQIMVRGEVEPALAAAPHRLSGELRCGGQDHFYLEGQIALATPGDDGDMHVLELDPASDRGAARRRASARPAVQRRHRRGAAHGRRLRRQGEPGDHHRRHRRRARLEDAAAGEAAAAARRRHARDRQAPSVPDPLRRRLRRRRAYSRARPHAGRERRQRRRPHAGGADARAVPRRQLLLPAERALPRPAVQDQHGVEHRVPRLWRAAGHARDRDHHRDDRAPAGPSRSTPCGGAISTASAATT